MPLPLTSPSAAFIWATTTTTPTDPGGWLDFLTRGGLLGGALLIIYGLLSDRLVSGSRYRRELGARDKELELWRAAARSSSSSLERVSSVFFPPEPPPERP